MGESPRDQEMSPTGTDHRMSAAYLIYSEWGPLRAVPRDERLESSFPDMGQAERAAWIAIFDEVDQEVWRFAEKGGPRLWSFRNFEQEMTRRFPFMNNEALQRAWTLCGYYTAHEGY